jgi:glycosyltransferase involved in cell wall biosynthesis
VSELRPTARPFVSVIVSARNAEAEIAPCLASLERVAYPTDRREVIVVDCGSRDRTAEIVKRYGQVGYLREGRYGVSHARNRGIGASRGEVVAFTDTDCVVSTEWISELADGFANERVGAVAGAILPFPPRTKVELYAARRSSHSQVRPMSHPLRPFAMTPNLAVRRDLLERIGRFDTRFPGGGWEDADLCWRLLRRTDLEIRYAPRAVVLHRYRSTAREFLVQHYRYGYGLGLIHGKYRGELRRGWRDPRPYGGLIATTARLAGAAIRAAVTRGERTDLTFPYLDFLRQLGQRGGFLVAAVRR